MGLELKPEIATALAALAAAEGVSVEDYLQAFVKRNSTQTADRQNRKTVVESMLELQKRVKPDPDGWTVRDYINHGRH